MFTDHRSHYAPSRGEADLQLSGGRVELIKISNHLSRCHQKLTNHYWNVSPCGEEAGLQLIRSGGRVDCFLSWPPRSPGAAPLIVTRPHPCRRGNKKELEISTFSKETCFCTFTFYGFLIVTRPTLVVAEIKKANFSDEIYPHYYQNQKGKVG